MRLIVNDDTRSEAVFIWMLLLGKVLNNEYYICNQKQKTEKTKSKKT